MTASPEQPPSTVSRLAGTRQDGEIGLRWSWVEHAVWTERMLTALEQGVKGGCWFRLMDKVFAELNLFAAARRVVANKGAAGVDHVTVEHSHPNTFESVDGWVRMRLRSILRRRMSRKGRGRGTDHQRWPNAYFAEQGLFSLATAHARIVQSSRR